jgi:predicted dehydrogenase
MALSLRTIRNARLSPSPERTVRFGVIGTGRIAADFANDLRHAKNAALHAVLSRDIKSAEAFQKAHGTAKAYCLMADFMADPDIDAVYVATPNTSHARFALASIRAGKPVLVEKPLAASAGEAEDIAAAARMHSVLVMEAMWIRFLPGVLRAKAMIDAGMIGAVRHVRAELCYRHEFDPKSRLFSKALGGGASLDLGVYLLSLTQMLFGAPDRASGDWKAAPSGVDSEARYRLAYPAFTADLAASFERDGANVFEIEGSTGVLRLEDPFIRAKSLRVLRGAAMRSKLLRPPLGQRTGKAAKLAARLPLPGQKRLLFAYEGHGLRFEAAAFADAARAGSAVLGGVSLADSISVLKMIDAVLAQPPSD